MGNDILNVKRFVIIPIGISACKELSGTDKIIFGTIYSFFRDRKLFYANNQYISEVVGITKSSASKSISKLKRLGYLEKKINGHDDNGYPKRFLKFTEKGIELAFKDIARKHTHRGEDSFADEYKDMVDE